MKCTVLVPSYKRIPSAIELVERLRRQDHPDFEILVVEQTPEPDPADLARLEALAREDPRIRVERHPPLGVGGARNAGIASARGEIMLNIDDDDLPARDDFVSQHMKNFSDPSCIAVHGSETRLSGRIGGLEQKVPWLAYRWCMSYSLFGTPRAFPGLRVRKEGIAYLRGGNSSIRVDYARRAGGWTDDIENGQEEHDFSFRLKKLMGPGDYMVFDPTCAKLRRMDIPGGANRRMGTLAREMDGNVRFYFRVIARHMPFRFALLLPLYPWVIFVRAVGWILDDRAHEPLASRLRALAELLALFPFLFVRSLFRVFFVSRPKTPATAV